MPEDSNLNDETAAQEWDERKSLLMEGLLGESHDRVMHALIPYAIGGALDLYYYPNRIPGTAIATKELSELPREGSKNDVFDCYELVMFTRHPVELEQVKNQNHPFGRIHKTISAILNPMARYSAEACLNPRETCEFPQEFDHIGGKCIIFDAYPDSNPANPEKFGLLAIIEVFRSEMEYAQHHGTAALIERLKAAGHYPYSDMDRKPVA